MMFKAGELRVAIDDLRQLMKTAGLNWKVRLENYSDDDYSIVVDNTFEIYKSDDEGKYLVTVWEETPGTYWDPPDDEQIDLESVSFTQIIPRMIQYYLDNHYESILSYREYIKENNGFSER